MDGDINSHLDLIFAVLPFSPAAIKIAEKLQLMVQVLLLINSLFP